MALTPDQMREVQHYQQVAKKQGLMWLRFAPQPGVIAPDDLINNPRVPANRDEPTGWAHLDQGSRDVHYFSASCNQVGRLGCMECRGNALGKSLGKIFR